MSFVWDKTRLNWFKTHESLHALRVRLRSFLENETETYHRFLRETLSSCTKDAICEMRCDGKKWHKKPFQIPECEVCTPWRVLILANHTSKGSVHWKECFPHLWPTEKWEVAKVYMPQGHRDHRCFDQFDIAALLNLMSKCKHFHEFVKDQQINKVTSVRNRVMHSPDSTVAQSDFELFLSTIKTFALLLQDHAPDLKTLPEEIDKICETIDEELAFTLDRVIPQSLITRTEEEPILNPIEMRRQRCLEMEQRALEEKIHYLSQRCEDDPEGVKEEVYRTLRWLLVDFELFKKMHPQMMQLKRRAEQQEQQKNTVGARIMQSCQIA